MTEKIISHVSKEKKEFVKELANLVKTKRTMLIVSIKNIPASQCQEITKKLRGRAIVKVPRRKLIMRAVDDSGETIAKQLEPKIKDNIAVLFSDLDCFDLSAELVRNKIPSKASAGQEAPEDIEIPAGPTDLIPGPAISELGAVGIQIQIDKGKINIKEPKMVAKKGQKITAAVADILSKLDIKPFSISLVPLAGYDSKEKKVYLEININTEKALADLKESFGRALPFAVEIGYPSEDTIKYLLQKASLRAKALEKFENAPEVNSEGGN
jgi:large subunit ribosomal protein L10